MKSTLQNMVLSLTGITVIAAAALGFTDMLTAQARAEAQDKALADALGAVLPPFDTQLSCDTLPEGLVVYRTAMQGTPAGTAVKSFSDNGFSGRITVLFGFDGNGTVTGYRVLAHVETPGLGAKAVDWFATAGTTHNVTGTTDPLKVSKDGGDIDAITGATITSRAFLEALHKARTALGAQKTSQP